MEHPTQSVDYQAPFNPWGDLKPVKSALTIIWQTDFKRKVKKVHWEADKTVQIKERLTSHKNPSIIKRSSVEREMVWDDFRAK